MTAAASYRLEACACPLCGEPPPTKTRAAFGPYRVVDCRSCSMRYLSPRVQESDVPRLYGSEGLLGERRSRRRILLLYLHRAPSRPHVRPAPFAAAAASMRCPPPRRRMRSRRRPRGGAVSRLRSVGARRIRNRSRGCVLSPSGPRGPRAAFGPPLSRGFFQRHHALRRHRACLRPPRSRGGSRVAPRAGGAHRGVATPNVKSLLARVTGRRWVSYKIPEHVAYFSPDTLADALAPVFEIEHVSSCGQYVTPAFLLSRIGDALPFGGGLLRAASQLLSRFAPRST